MHMVCVPCTSIRMNLALSSNHSCSALLILCLLCACRWSSWGLTSSLPWCPACKIASRPRLAQVRGVCVGVTITLPPPALAAGLRAVFPGEHWGGSWWFSDSAEGQQSWCLYWALEEESRGALPLLQFFPEGIECSCFLSLVLPSLLDRLGDSKDSVREQDQTLLLKIMEQAANPQVCSTALHSMSDWLCKKRKTFFCQKVFSAIFLSEMVSSPYTLL